MLDALTPEPSTRITYAPGTTCVPVASVADHVAVNVPAAAKPSNTVATNLPNVSYTRTDTLPFSGSVTANDAFDVVGFG